ncbi:TRAP transporter substrate-binding protein DctP [Nitratireductor rhodophyticola]|uniref:TRAP transporter substrate-binding protein DctP n=1 Tax=Nitratireductor rhodophyticola TaxID=2854036 RepID=UPI000C6062B6|nr:TRAP transporter substrate-binding protein DctP [Nitratireductor rhodophyticola]MAW86838.1 C4-dicarboxylate ABC transporter substrate-binding protein [Phyllobacteriaceae bacterium]MEC9246993.1 TRAP transporter substrate-binding protein DctP [Pseudomonadota bacterium]WPZ15225.1 TRAP transporter substrate-binding protein DctP [Nitratireductor rhodophyticola]
MFLSLKRLALVGAVAFATFGAQAQEVTWRVPTSVPEGSPFYVNFLERFADNVGLLTDGAVEIQPFGAGILVPALQVYDGVKDGIVEAGHSTPSYLVNQDPVNAIFAGFPGGMGPEAYSTWIFEEGGKEKLAEIRAEEGLKSLVVGIGSSEIMAHANKPIKSAADLKGLKYRTSGPWAEVMRDYFDAVPTVVPPGEIYTLLERKGVDAIEWGPPSGNLPEGFHEAAPYIVVPGVHQPTFLWEVVVKQETWDALDEALRAKIEAAAELTTLQSLVHFYDQDMKAMETLRASKAEVIELDAAFQKELSDAGRDWIKKTAEAQKAEGKPRMAEILEGYLAYEDRWAEQSGYLIRNEK